MGQSVACCVTTQNSMSPPRKDRQYREPSMVSMNYQNENEVVPNFTEEISGRSRNVSQCSSISSINNYTLAQSQMHRTLEMEDEEDEKFQTVHSFEEHSISYSNMEFPQQYNHHLEQDRIIDSDSVAAFLDKLDDDFSEYVHKLDLENIQLWLKTENETKLPLGKIYYYFSNEYTCDELIDVVFNYKRRKEWDSNTLEYYAIDTINPFFSLYYMTIKFPFPFTNRDFVEKRIKFMKDDSYYVYFSAAPSQVYPENKKFVRSFTHFGGVKITKEENRIRYMCMSLMDLKIKIIPAGIMKSFIPGTTKSFYKQTIEELERGRQLKQLQHNKMENGVAKN